MIHFSSAVHGNKLLSVTDNIQPFRITATTLRHFEYMKTTLQWGISLLEDEVRREMLSLIELRQRLYLLDNSGFSVVCYGW